jgi:hypothetical protein
MRQTTGWRIPEMQNSFSATRDVIIRTEHFHDAVRFYESVLGLKAIHRSESLVGFDAGAFRLYVEPGAAHGAVFEFRVADFQAARAALLAAQCALQEEVHRFRAVICAIPTGWCSILSKPLRHDQRSDSIAGAKPAPAGLAVVAHTIETLKASGKDAITSIAAGVRHSNVVPIY